MADDVPTTHPEPSPGATAPAVAAAPAGKRRRTPHLLRRWTGALVIAIAAFALRAAYLYQVSPAPFFDELKGDARAYDAWAQRIAAGDWIGSEVFYQAPLYPYFLAALYTIFGHDLAALRFVQIVLGCAACAMIFDAARRWFSPAVGLVAGLMQAAYPPAMFFDLQIDKTVLDEVLLAAVLLSLSIISTTRRPTAWPCVTCGALLGLLCLTRENALILVAVVAAWLAWRERDVDPVKVRVRRAAQIILGTAVVLAPVALRNAWVGGELHLTTAQFGPNFYIGNGPEADGVYRPLRPARGDALYERTDATELAEAAEGRTLSPGGVSSYWTRRTLRAIADDPARWLALVGRKWLMVWSSAEVADSGDFDTHTAWSPLLRRIADVWHFGVLLPLAAAGVVLAWRDRPKHGILIVMIAVYSLATAGFYLFARYRYPLVPMLVPLAAAGVVQGARACAAVEGKRIAGALLAAVVFGVISNTAWALPLRIRGADYYNRAIAHERRGEPDAALAAYRRAIRINPQLVEAYNNLGLLLAKQGQLDAAIAEYQTALRVNPDDDAAHTNLGMVLAQQRRLPEAIAHFREAVRYKPDLTAAWLNLGIALAMQGDRDEAAKAFETVLAQQPDHPQAKQWLARVRAKPPTRPASAPS